MKGLTGLFNCMILMFLLYSSEPHAGANSIQTDRYTVVRLTASRSQIDPLQTVVNIKFPKSVMTVREAMNWLLDESGYALAERENWSEAMAIMMSKRLPMSQRDFAKNPMTLNDLLPVLAGETFEMVKDPLRRLVTFRLKDEYQELIDG